MVFVIESCLRIPSVLPPLLDTPNARPQVGPAVTKKFLGEEHNLMTCFLSFNRLGLFAILLLVGIASALHAQPNTTFTILDAPNALVTVGFSINNRGDVVGYVLDVNHSPAKRCFVRDRNGNFTVFDGPNAQPAYCLSINNGGDVTGQFYDESLRFHSFVRDRNGDFTVFDVPNASDTFASAINDRGDIVGQFCSAPR